MPALYRKKNDALLGHVSDRDIQILVDQLEEEDRADRDYFINPPTIDLLETAGASPALVKMLRDAVGSSEGIDIRYEN